MKALDVVKSRVDIGPSGARTGLNARPDGSLTQKTNILIRLSHSTDLRRAQEMNR
jgi:hypothetical protein